MIHYFNRSTPELDGGAVDHVEIGLLPIVHR